MAYPPAAGPNRGATNSGTSTPQSHSSLPQKPPAQPNSLPPRPVNGASGSFNRSSGFGAFKPRSVAPSGSSWPQASRQYAPSISAGAVPNPVQHTPQAAAGAQAYGAQAYGANQYYAQQTQTPYQTQASPYNQPEVPQIRNPFPLLGQGGSANDYDPEEAAQIAQWQSAYISKDDSSSKPFSRNRAEGAASAGGANAIPLGGANRDAAANIDISGIAPTNSGVAAVVAGADGKQTTVVRSGGGKTWQDTSLLEWDPAHFRLFIGNLAGEVTDDSLLKAFSKYTSLQKARVVRDKRTTKSKGYGFVSFSDGDDYFQAAKDMQGKYIGSHPVLIKRSTTDIKASAPSDKKKQFKGKHSSGGHANTGAGVSKKQAKSKGGLKILG